MDLKTFKRKLDAYGADFMRWEGADERAARAFMAQSVEAQKLHAQAEKLDHALDSFGVVASRHTIMGGVRSRIGAAEGESAKIMPFPLRIEMPPWKVAVGMGGAAAAAAVVLVFATIPDGIAVRVEPSPAPMIAAMPEGGQGQIDAFVSEIASWMEEDEQADEILAMLDVPTIPAEEEEVDQFLDDLYKADEAYVTGRSGTDTDAVPEEPDIWDVFYPVTESP